MGPTRRLDVRDLEAVPVDSQTCRTLVEQSNAHLRSAQMLEELDAEGAFQLAYDGCRKVAPADVGDAIEILGELLAGLPAVVERQLA